MNNEFVFDAIPLYLIVTGETEEKGIKPLFRPLGELTPSTWFVEEIYRIPQAGRLNSPPPGRNPRKALTRLQHAIEKSLGKLQRSPRMLVVILDDTESRVGEGTENEERVVLNGAVLANERFLVYRHELDKVPLVRDRSSVHFFQTMLESLFVADAQAVKSVLNVDIDIGTQDPESIGNPFRLIDREVRERKKDHRRDDSVPGQFDKIEHGKELLRTIHLDSILGNPAHCCSLRTLLKWLVIAAGFQPGPRFHLAEGCLSDLTKGQLDQLPIPPA